MSGNEVNHNIGEKRVEMR